MEPRISTCTPWASEADICLPCLDADFPADLLDNMLQIASDLLFELSGRRFPGECESTVRPCAQRTPYDPPPAYRYSSWFSSWPTGSWPSAFCGCSIPRSCGCPRPSEITLGVEPVISIEEVKVDGAVLDPSLYRVDDYKFLVRLPDPGETFTGWPCCSTVLLPDTEPDTFSVTFTYGRNPPPAGVHAAAVLACELALSCNPISGAECRLPRRVQSITRQGVSMVLLDPMEFLRAGGLGIYEVDSFIATYNPHNLRRAATVISPDRLERVRRIDTGLPSGS